MITIPDDELVVKIKVDSTEFADKLSKSQQEVKKFGDQVKSSSTESADTFKKSADDMNRSQEQTKDAGEKTTKTLVEQGREIRTAGRNYALANIEQIQFNQMMTMVGNTATQWGTKMQGSQNIVNKGLADFSAAMNKATGGLVVYLGAGVQVIGMIIDMYAQYQRILIMIGRVMAERAIATAAKQAETVATVELTVAQNALNVSMLANPYVAVAAGIIAIGAAIAVGIAALTNYKENQEATARAIQSTIDKLDRAKNKFREMITGEKEPSDLLQQKTDLQEQISTLESKAGAAEALGMAERAAAYHDQIFSLNEDLGELNYRIGKSRDTYTPSGTSLIKQAEEIKKAAEAAFAANNPINWWTSPGEKARIERGMKTSGEAAVEAYLEGMLTEASNEQTRSTLESIAGYFGVTLEAHSPPKAGPLKDITVWGSNLMSAYADGMNRGSSEIVRAGATISRGAADRIASNSSTTHNNSMDNRNYNIAPTIQVINNVDLNDPQIKMDIARAVSQEVRRMVAVS